ncbi:glycoside hydrolase family 31 protein [Flavobacterium subsaxonicum]|uniref:Glycosyl hydrolase family 31 n=1 Tax=Flavobacterium subsaxonicum WB 4.1-42 = DSM 21790 TaxID=1121898 RepID=A0A0A2MLS7_9FLAO|nr:TIM-barrel domain-containing protein [Flavobacterium subsaxonicum]KGO93602.1 glycosyl hydrolase family 31 [Flavobacterium subsaxonicum WB 4.1-42 = DSM 21790]
MKRFFILFFSLIPALLFAQSYQSHTLRKDGLQIELAEGILTIKPLSAKAISIQWEKELKEEQEFIFVSNPATIKFKFKDTADKLKLFTEMVMVTFDKKSGAIDYSDINGKIFLSEKAGSRKLIRDSIMGEPCFIAEQSFNSPKDEYLFGLGQFQDGNYNLRNISRKLTQVNTQIAIPFLYSSKGYGILWHQYGLTNFNPADTFIPLLKSTTILGEKADANVTTTAGTQKISQEQSLHTAKFTAIKDGNYTFMLDMGAMDNRHFLSIDNVPYIDFSNMWLPPAVSKMIYLKAGEHTINVVCKTANTPKLTWKQESDETTFRSPNAKSLYYVVFYGNDADDIIADYRNLSGNVPMLPQWAYGFWQCRERYTSGKHLVETIQEFRNKKLPVDVIVQDWQYWGKYGWGVPKFDETNYPNPEKFIKQLHDLNAHLSISVWENLDKKSDVAKEYLAKDLYIPNSDWIDIYKPETQKTHWNVLNTNLFSKGVDSWWMDATEPENDALVGKQTYYGLGDFYRLTYPLFVSKTVYEGQRNTNPDKRVVTLTRSAFAGQQRYGTINWSGDIGWDWDTYKRQIVAGLNYNLTGMPYWTTDIGGFFRPGPGQYTDKKYHEILTRWFQWGVFNSIFRIHGYGTETEPWKYGPEVEANMREMLNLRSALMPYIYSEAWQVSKNGSTIMRPLVMDFASDTIAIQQPYEYMFGKSILVAPITEPNIKVWNVYLPKGSDWYNYWSGKHFTGGKTITTDAPLNKIPLFVKAGSILPIGEVMQYASEKPRDTIDIHIYPGADAKFDLYEDEGDNYNYEKGSYTIIPFVWSEKDQTLTIGKLQGNYAGHLKKRVFNITIAEKVDAKNEPLKMKIFYTGSRILINEIKY